MGGEHRIMCGNFRYVMWFGWRGDASMKTSQLPFLPLSNIKKLNNSFSNIKTYIVTKAI